MKSENEIMHLLEHKKMLKEKKEALGNYTEVNILEVQINILNWILK